MSLMKEIKKLIIIIIIIIVKNKIKSIYYRK